MPNHVDPRLQEPGEPRSVQDGYPAFGVVDIALTPPPLFDMRHMSWGEDHTVSWDLAHALLAVFMMFLYHDDIIRQGT